MHRVDVAYALDRPMELSVDHDGRIVADVVAQWALRHGRPFALHLAGLAGGSFGQQTGLPETVHISLNAAEFCRTLDTVYDTCQGSPVCSVASVLRSIANRWRSNLLCGIGGGEDMPGHDAFEPGYTGNENDDPTHLHRPYVRHVHTDWRRDNYGRWVSETWDQSKWEVICTECGDDEGPAEDQSPVIQQFRGAYPTEHKALHAAHAHERKSNPALRWLPGSTVPPPAGPL
jgi:hypothetical protein